MKCLLLVLFFAAAVVDGAILYESGKWCWKNRYVQSRLFDTSGYTRLQAINRCERMTFDKRRDLFTVCHHGANWKCYTYKYAEESRKGTYYCHSRWKKGCNIYRVGNGDNKGKGLKWGPVIVKGLTNFERCGPSYKADCPSDGCCSKHYWCGNSYDHCHCNGCVDFRKTGGGSSGCSSQVSQLKGKVSSFVAQVTSLKKQLAYSKSHPVCIGK